MFPYSIDSKKFLKYYFPNLGFRDSAQHKRRTQIGKKCAESWESLNSAASGSDLSSKNLPRDHDPKTTSEAHSTTSRGEIVLSLLED